MVPKKKGHIGLFFVYEVRLVTYSGHTAEMFSRKTQKQNYCKNDSVMSLVTHI